MAVLKHGVAESVTPAGELTKPPAGIYRVAITKTEDIKIKRKDENGSEVEKDAFRMALKITAEGNPKEAAGQKIPAYAAQYTYPEKADDAVNGQFLKLLMSSTGKSEKDARAIFSKFDPLSHLAPKDGKEKVIWINWKPDAREYKDKNGATKFGDVLVILTADEAKEAREEAKKNAAAAGGKATSDDPFLSGGAASEAKDNAAPNTSTDAGGSDDDLFNT